MSITQERNNYFVKLPTGDFMGTFEDGRIRINSTQGDIQYSKDKDRLFFAGHEFARREFLEAEARRDQAIRTSFHGAWRGVPTEGGLILIDFLIIELLDNGAFAIREREVMDNTEYRSVRYDNGTISGILRKEVDNEWTTPFEIKKTGENTISYRDERGEERLERLIEVDSFAGNWAGYYLNYGGGPGREVEDTSQTFSSTITKEAGKYRIVLQMTGSAPESLLARILDGKLVAEGDARRFYKFQVPTVELSPNGNLTYRDGARDIRLKRRPSRS